jgi:hypothetical protein
VEPVLIVASPNNKFHFEDAIEPGDRDAAPGLG